MSKEGILSNFRNRGILAWLFGVVLVVFYIFLYFGDGIDKGFFWGKTWKNFYENIYGKQKSSMESEISALRKDIAKIKKENAQSIPLVSNKANLASLEKDLKSKREELGVIKRQYSVLYKSAYTKERGEYISSYYKKNKVQLSGEYYSTLVELQKKPSAQQFLHYFYTLLNPLSKFLRNKPADKWFLYGFLYTLLVVSMGIRFMRRWNHDKYQKVRTLSVMFFQFGIAFTLPGILESLGSKGFFFHYFWPLKFDYIFPSTLNGLPKAMAIWTIMVSFVAVPILTYFFGKRWYCSWVCGCGALANTFGDPFRHLSDKSKKAWQVEIFTVHFILAVTVVATIIIVMNQLGRFSGEMRSFAFGVQKWYLFFVSAGFAGVIGTGFYPLAGTRVWCRFGCPQAAILGILQKFFSRFRITTNGEQCMSCGNCSTYCEMGIDVRAYAMAGKDIVRASCVGCGLCMSVCPRGVLKLENGPRKNKNL